MTMELQDVTRLVQEGAAFERGRKQGRESARKSNFFLNAEDGSSEVAKKKKKKEGKQRSQSKEEKRRRKKISAAVAGSAVATLPRYSTRGEKI